MLILINFNPVEEPEVKKKKQDPEKSFFSSVLDESSDEESTGVRVESAREEVSRYLKTRNKKDLFQFWKSSKRMYPRLYNVAKHTLNVPATSTPSERSFSVAGRLLEDRRSVLDPDKADQLLFLHSNLNTL